MVEINKRVINKVKLTEGRTLTVDFTEYLSDGTTRKHPGVKCDQLYSDDITKAFTRLKTHLVSICDLREMDKLIDLDDFDNENLIKIEIQSISISGSSDAEGVVITGTKEIGEKIFNINTPMTELEGEYPHGAELAEIVEAIRFEASEYLFNGKYAVKQMEIEFPEEKDEFETSSKITKQGLDNRQKEQDQREIEQNNKDREIKDKYETLARSIKRVANI